MLLHGSSLVRSACLRDTAQASSKLSSKANRPGLTTKSSRLQLGKLPGGGAEFLINPFRPVLSSKLQCRAQSGSITADRSGPPESQPQKFAGFPLVKKTYGLLRNNFWIVLAAFLLCDGFTWVLHRCSHRLTNLVAVRLLPDVSAGAIGNLWWISNDATIANFQTGYQYLVGLVFLAVFPLNILLRTLATAVAILACHQDEGPGRSVRGVLEGLRQQWQRARQRWLQLWEVELLLAVRVIPLSGLSLLVLPLPWTLPRLMALSATTSLAVLEGASSGDALQQSQRRLRPFWRSIAWPYLVLAVGARLMDMAKVAAFGALPPRLQRDLPELSIAIFFIMSLATFVLCRMRDLLGLAAYQMTSDPAGAGPLPTKPYRPSA